MIDRRRVILLGAAAGAGLPGVWSPLAHAAGMTRVTAYAFTFKGLDGGEILLASYAGHPLLVVNTASLCGYTPQYAGLQDLWARFRDRGLIVLGVPSNDFGGQEPGEAQEIASFCKSRYGVTFPMFEKVETTGPRRAELYAILATAKGEPGWNFRKYLVDKHGMPVAAWGSMTTPGSPEIANAIETALAAP